MITDFHSWHLDTAGIFCCFRVSITVTDHQGAHKSGQLVLPPQVCVQVPVITWSRAWERGFAWRHSVYNVINFAGHAFAETNERAPEIAERNLSDSDWLRWLSENFRLWITRHCTRRTAIGNDFGNTDRHLAELNVFGCLRTEPDQNFKETAFVFGT